jgi:MEDS: MEthanogen/methylotroph, DcmR Sensory domain
VVQFYTRDSFLLDGLCEFVRCALEDGESVIVVVSQAHRDGLRQRIKAAGIGTRIASRAGRYVLLDAAETMAKFMTGNMPDRRKFESVMGMVIRRAEAAALVKYRRVAIFGEMVALLWAEKKFDAAIRLEQLWNELAQTHFFYLRCAYPVSGFQGELKGEPYCAVCAEHSVVVPAEDVA